jgi:hypothetical protein
VAVPLPLFDEGDAAREGSGLADSVAVGAPVDVTVKVPLTPSVKVVLHWPR